MADNYALYKELREKYPVLRYDGYEYTLSAGELFVRFDFSIPGAADFHPCWHIARVREAKVDEKALDALVFALGMTELISYYKCACPPAIEVNCGALDRDGAEFFSHLMRCGLGEFLYTNSIPVDSPLGEFVFSGEPKPLLPPLDAGCRERTLVPVGGGKDSAVSLELLREKTDIYPYIINPRGATQNTVERAGLSEKAVIARRTIDPALLELNAKGFLNGHTPFSAIVAFSSVLAAYINGIGYVALSNESSANESTVEGSFVNHQYSKSFDFERDFREYEKKHIGSGVDYFSLLRPWTELHIASVFSRLTKYHDIFRSCNAGSKADEWCGVCAKCLFVAIILSPFMSREKLCGIFGRDILDDPALTDTFEKLIGVQSEKPFECVGSRGEVNAALRATCERWEDLPYLLRLYRDSMPHTDDKIEDHMLSVSENAVPAEFSPVVYGSSFTEYLSCLTYNKRVLILGYGREGRSSYALISSLNSAAALDIADAGSPEGIPEGARLYSGEGYLEAIDDYDIVLKTPGVVLPRPREEYKAQISSQVELFMGFYRKNIIGITGTKGKSTTSTLLYHTLRSAGIDCVLGGNIGIPVFELIGDIGQQTRIVLELSCHQLEYCSVSPATSLLLNFYEDHLDHYGSYEKYKAAKRNIYLHAERDDLLISGVDAPNAPCRVCRPDTGTLPFGSLEETGTRLRGAHNMHNCAAVLCAARTLGVSDEEFLSALKSYRPLPHRLEFVGNFGGIDWYDDSISTTAQSAISAARAVPNARTLLLGGMDRGIDYTPLAGFIRSGEIENVILMYDAGERIASLLSPDTPARVFSVSDLREAVDKAGKITPEGGACILSPAAASYGYFINFEERGDKFKEYVKKQ